MTDKPLASCLKCKTAVPVSAKICPSCSHKFSIAEAAAMAAIASSEKNIAKKAAKKAEIKVAPASVERKRGVPKGLLIGLGVVAAAWIGFVILVAIIGPKETKPSKTPPPLSSASEIKALVDRTAEDAKKAYVEKVNREIVSLESIKPLSLEDVTTRDEITLNAALIGAWAKVYFEGDTLGLDAGGEARRQKLKGLISKAQKQRFPVLRRAQAKIFNDIMWENDVTVAPVGSGIRLTGGMFAANRNIANAMKALRETADILRYRRITFEWYRGSESTYYDLKPLPDGEVAELSGNRWVPKD